ncbi:MAG: hypothetical protein HKN47_16595 [Pirellulaceae bacterium]|nr:hypothetical protein [Pirellulaceae bacterium]
MFLALVVWASGVSANGRETTGGDSTDSVCEIQNCIAQLADDSYAIRTEAKRRILLYSDDPAMEARTTRLLELAGRDNSLEVRVGSRRLLDQIQMKRIDRQLRLLRSTDDPSTTITLPGWKRFSTIAGSDVHARTLFAEMVVQHYESLRWIENWNSGERATHDLAGDAVGSLSDDATALMYRWLNPYTLPSDDATMWALLFCCDSPDVHHGQGAISTRIALALSQTTVGPRMDSDGDAIVMDRMVGHWVTNAKGIHLPRERLMIALQYGCTEQANLICDQLLADATATPSAQAMAMLCGSVLQRPDMEQQLLQRIDDERTAHVWQLIASKKRKIRTQVRDVAMALLLHRNGIDPREAGFVDLQADPLVVFRDHSLGFSDDRSRRDAYRSAAAALEKSAHSDR